MMSTKTLVQLAKKWQRVAAIGRKRLTWLSSSAEQTKGSCGASSSVAGKGNFVVYTVDGMRFEVPVVLLGTTVFTELLRMSQEEFGFVGTDDGRITLPCDASVMEYAMSMLRRSASAEMEAADQIKNEENRVKLAVMAEKNRIMMARGSTGRDGAD